MALVVSPLGVISDLPDDHVGAANWNEGCVRICRGGESVVVAVDSDRLTGPAIAATLYELADMRPRAICFAFEAERIIQVIVGTAEAFPHIYEVFADGNAIGGRPGRPWLLGVINDQFEVSIESTTGFFDIRPRCTPAIPVGRFSEGR
jgi:hypothetical protein